MNQPAAHRRATQRGLTLVECATVLSVMATVASMATPAFERSVERRRIEGTAAQIETDVHFARSLAVARNAPVRISFSAQDGASCYVIHTGAAGECGCTPAGQATCSGDAESMRAVRLDAELGVDLHSNSASMLFDPVKGTATPTGTIKVTGRSGSAIHQVVNIMGRVRSCSPAPAIAGYKPC